MAEQRYLIWSEEHGLWWRPGERGYTNNLCAAGLYSKERADAIVKSANGHGHFWGIIYLTPDYSSGSYLLMQRAIPPQPRGGCYAR